MTERFTYRGIRYEVTRLGVRHYVVKAGSPGADCKKTFESLDKARDFTEYMLDRGMESHRWPLCDGFSGRLERIASIGP